MRRTDTLRQTDIDQGFLPGRSPREPLLVTDLLGALGVAKATAAKKRAAVKRWLAKHEPNRLLHDDLKERGYLD